MVTSTKRVRVILEADARAYDQAMRQAEQATTKFQRAADTAVRVGDRLTVGLSAPLALLGKAAVDAASDLSEAVNVTGLTFGEARAEIDAFARTASERIGQSERAAREATATFGGLLQNLGLAQDETVAWSQDLTVLASDLASAFNTDPADAVQALGAALRGETEPIRRYNVMLSDQAIRQEAVEMGLAATTAEVGNAEKAQAALSLIMEQTSAVQGDFANTADGLANSQRILAAQWEDTKAQLGENLLPIMERVVSVLSDVTSAFGDLPGGAQSTIVALGGIAVAAGPLLSVGGRLARNWDDITGALGRSGAAAVDVRGKLMSLNTLRFVGAAAAVGLLASRLADARNEADAFATAISQDAGDTLIDQLLALRGAEELLAERATSGWGDLDLGLARVALTGKDAFDQLDAVRRQIGLLEAQMEAAGISSEDYGQDLTAVTVAAGTTRSALDAVIPSVRETTQAVDGAASSHDSWMSALQSSQVVFDSAADYYRAMIDPVQAFTDVNADMADEVPESLDVINEALREQLDAQLNWADNFANVAARVPAEFLPELERIATESPELLALMRDGSDAELEEFVLLSGQRGDEAVAALSDALGVMPDIGRRFGQDTADALTERLASGVLTAADISWAYTEALRTGVNPLLLALGGNSIPAQARALGVPVGVMRNTGGPIPGGGPDRDSVPALLTPGEYVVRRRAVQMYGPAAMEAINDGTAMVHLNTGGFASLDDVPAVPSYSPFRTMVHDPGQRQSTVAREATVEWLKANLAPQLGPGIGWQAMWQAVQAAQAMGQLPGSLQLTSAFRPGAVTRGTGRQSYHALGRAIDVAGPSSAMGSMMDWMGQHYLGVTREGLYTPWESRQILSGRYSNTSNPKTRADHYDHVHWAMANGAIVKATPDGTRALIGEGGSDEAVIPLDRALAVQVTGFSGSAAQDLAIEALGGASGVPQAGADPLAAMIAAMSPDEVRALTEEIAANREMLRVETLTAEERLAEVTALMQGAVPYTDEWVDLLREAQQLEEQIARDAAQAADEIARQVREQQQAAEAAQRTADALGDDLNRLLDQRDRLQEQAANAVRDHATAVADAQTRAAREVNDLTRARQDALFGAFGSVDQRFAVGWGNLTSQYADELDRRFALFDEWADGVQQLRDRGVSEDVIAQLGLDDPSNLADVRLFVNATDAELQRLTDALSRNQQQTADTAQREADMLLGALGTAISNVRETLAVTLDDLGGQLSEKLTTIGLEMAALGTDQGMSYADALTEALASGLPGVIALAEQYQAALRDAQEAAAAAAAMGAGSGSGGTSSWRPGGTGVNQWAPINYRLFDSGGRWPSGTAGLNLSGKDEYVFTQEQLRSIRPSGAQTVSLAGARFDLVLDNGPTLTAYVKDTSRAAVQEDAYTRQLQGAR